MSCYGFVCSSIKIQNLGFTDGPKKTPVPDSKFLVSHNCVRPSPLGKSRDAMHRRSIANAINSK